MPTALILEDDADTVALLQRALEQEGYSVVAAERASQAIDLFDQHKPDLLLLDIGLPGADGFFALRRLRARHESLADGRKRMFLMVSARDDFNAAEDAARFGADSFLPKPIQLKELQARARAFKDELR